MDYDVFKKINEFNRLYLVKLQAGLAPYGLTPANWALLDYLKKNGPSKSSQIAFDWSIERPSIAPNVKQLLAKGLIEAEAGRDKREKFLTLSPEGLDQYASMTAALDPVRRAIIRDLTNSQYENLISSLDIMLKQIKE